MTTGFSKMLPRDCDVLAPDGSEVRILLSLAGGSMAHFLLSAGQVSRAVRHRTVAEIWYVLSGVGEMWQSADGCEKVEKLSAGTCVTIPAGCSFQFRCIGNHPLAAIAITMPPWPGDGEAELVEGTWEPIVG
jgi:mannose-6-phosphate isomerase-like protein (cupin superfamily)